MPFVTCRGSFGRGSLAWRSLRFALTADPGEWRGRALDSQWVKAREGQPLLTSVTMFRWKYDILLDRPLPGDDWRAGLIWSHSEAFGVAASVVPCTPPPADTFCHISFSTQYAVAG